MPQESNVFMRRAIRETYMRGYGLRYLAIKIN